MRRALLASILAIGVPAAGFAGGAAAHTETFPSSVSINFVDRPGPDLFRGRVMSPNPNCIEKRIIRLWRVVEGPDDFIDSDVSEDNGTWDIDVEGGPIPGTYYVTALARNIGPSGHQHICARAVSRRIAVAG